MLGYVRKTFTYLNSQIRFKIIFPFLLLTVIVAALGTYFSVRSLTESLDERFTRQLVGAGGQVTDQLGQREAAHLALARAVAFTQGIDQALLNNDRMQLEGLLFPLVANDGKIDRVDVIDAERRPLVGIYRPPGSRTVGDYRAAVQTSLPDSVIIDRVLSGMVDEQGDKYIALTTIDDHAMLVTVGPIKQNDEVIGAVLVGSYVDDLLRSLKQTTFADVSLYNLEGELVSTTLPVDETTRPVISLESPDVRPMVALEGEYISRRSISLEGREYDLLYSAFFARQEPLVIYSVAMPTAFMEAQTNQAFIRMLYLVLPALLLVFGIGYLLTYVITNRLKQLMENARAVASGDFSRRTKISSGDEIGLLARSLDDMTESLADYTNTLQDRIDELIALYESSSAVTIRSSLNLEYVLLAVTNSVKTAVRGTEQVIIHLLDEQQQTLLPKISYPSLNGKEPLPALRFDSQQGLKKFLAVMYPQVMNTAALKAYAREPVSLQETTDLIITPLVAGRETIGMLTLIPEAGYTPENLLNEDRKRLLSTLANQTAIAVKNAQLFEATQDAYEELRRLDDLKTEFINIAAHELRTPLGAMMGYASFAQKRVPPDLQKTMDFLMASTLRMRTMVDAMLTIQRLDAGTAFVRARPTDLRKIINKTIADFRAMAELQDKDLSFNYPDTLPSIEVDPEKIDLVCSNLLSNAIKFTPEDGCIEVNIIDEKDSVLITVRDTGVGIAEAEQERIFDRFYQVPVDHIAGHSGMGIGLTTVKYLVELHQGQVWVKSQLGQGSTFFVRLPKIFEAAPEPPSPPESEAVQPLLLKTDMLADVEQKG